MFSFCELLLSLLSLEINSVQFADESKIFCSGKTVVKSVLKHMKPNILAGSVRPGLRHLERLEVSRVTSFRFVSSGNFQLPSVRKSKTHLSTSMLVIGIKVGISLLAPFTSISINFQRLHLEDQRRPTTLLYYTLKFEL